MLKLDSLAQRVPSVIWQYALAVVSGRHGAATRLGLKRTTLLSKMEKLGISRKYTLSIGKDEPKELAR